MTYFEACTGKGLFDAYISGCRLTFSLTGLVLNLGGSTGSNGSSGFRIT